MRLLGFSFDGADFGSDSPANANVGSDGEGVASSVVDSVSVLSHIDPPRASQVEGKEGPTTTGRPRRAATSRVEDSDEYQESDDSGSSHQEEEEVEDEALSAAADVDNVADGEEEEEEEVEPSRAPGTALSSVGVSWRERYEVVDFAVDVARRIYNANRGIDTSTGKFFEAACFCGLVHAQWVNEKQTPVRAGAIKKIIDNVLHMARQFFKRGEKLAGCEKWASAVNDGNLGVLSQTVQIISDKEHEALRKKAPKMKSVAVKRTLEDMSLKFDTFRKFLHLRYELTRHNGLKKKAGGAGNNISSSHQRSVLSKANRGSMGPVKTSFAVGGPSPKAAQPKVAQVRRPVGKRRAVAPLAPTKTSVSSVASPAPPSPALAPRPSPAPAPPSSPALVASSPAVTAADSATPSPGPNFGRRYDPAPSDLGDDADLDDDDDDEEPPSRTRRRRRRQSDETLAVVTLSTEKTKCETMRIGTEKYKIDQEVAMAREKLAFKERLMEKESDLRLKQMDLEAKRLELESKKLDIERENLALTRMTLERKVRRTESNDEK